MRIVIIVIIVVSCLLLGLAVAAKMLGRDAPAGRAAAGDKLLEREKAPEPAPGY